MTCSSAPFSFEFVVARAPFPWTITPLSVLLALSLVALVWGYVQHRKIVRAGSDLLEANRQLAAARLQLANEAESERRRIARDLHDQTLADLRRLMLLADEMRPDGAGKRDRPRPRHGRRGVPRRPRRRRAPAAPRSTGGLRAEIESVRRRFGASAKTWSVGAGDVGSRRAEWALAERVAHMPPDCKFTYEFSCDEHLEERLHFAPGVQMQVYRIVQEAVSNVCRHAAARRVRLSVAADDDGRFLLTLEDDGRGFDTDRRKSPAAGRGLASIRARASMIDAEVRWQRRPDPEGGGTPSRCVKRARPGKAKHKGRGSGVWEAGECLSRPPRPVPFLLLLTARWRGGGSRGGRWRCRGLLRCGRSCRGSGCRCRRGRGARRRRARLLLHAEAVTVATPLCCSSVSNSKASALTTTVWEVFV